MERIWKSKKMIPVRKVTHTGTKRRYFVRKIYGQFSPKFSCFAARCLCWYCHRVLVDESRMIKTQMGKHNRSEMLAVHGTPCVNRPVSVTVTVSSKGPEKKGTQLEGHYNNKE
jgi:hypothetical protein